MGFARAVLLASLASLASAGCKNILGYQDPVLVDAGTSGTDSSDGGDGGGGAFCYGSGLVQVCLAQAPTGSLSVSGTQMVDTTSSISCSSIVTSGGTGYCVLAYETIDITASATLEGTGNQPLVLLASGALTVSGTLDVASHRNGNSGPDANPSGCGSSGAGTNGGGAGGSLGSQGGNGGAPNASIAAQTPAPPTVLRGGCPGRDGGAPETSKGGDGGGAVYLISGTQITVSGEINASGAGGERSEATGLGGGAGGGSGGMIGLDAPTVNISGLVFANGGGGSEGNDATVRGNNGYDPSSGLGGVAGAGASAGGDGGAGAAGTASGTIGGDGVAGTAGGGGGGGGVGVIKLYGTQTGSGTVSPPAS